MQHPKTQEDMAHELYPQANEKDKRFLRYQLQFTGIDDDHYAHYKVNPDQIAKYDKESENIDRELADLL